MMALPQSEINRSAVMAVVLVRGQSKEGLQQILDETATEVLCRDFEMKLRVQLAEIVKKPIDEFSEEFMTDLVDRMRYNAEYTLTR